MDSSPLPIRRVGCCVLSLKSAQHGPLSHISSQPFHWPCFPIVDDLSHYCADKNSLMDQRPSTSYLTGFVVFCGRQSYQYQLYIRPL
jgi:hypothetical protein